MKIFIKLLVGWAVLLLVSCGKKPASLKTGPLPEKSVSGQVLSISFNEPIDTIDQQRAVYSSSFEIIGNMMDGLMQMADDGSVKKAICEEETVSSDGLLYTFKLRKDVFGQTESLLQLMTLFTAGNGRLTLRQNLNMRL